jgi:hypothetical protein
MTARQEDLGSGIWKAVEVARDRKWIARSPLLPGTTMKIVSEVLGVARSNLYVRAGRRSDWRDGRRGRRPLMTPTSWPRSSLRSRRCPLTVIDGRGRWSIGAVTMKATTGQS